MNISSNRYWKPRCAVGSINFGADEESLMSTSLKRIHDEEGDLTGWNVYGDETRFRVYCENKSIISISVHDQLLFKGVNLIAMTLDELKNELNSEGTDGENVEMPDGPQQVWQFEEYGLQIWTSNGIVITAICDDGM